MSEKLSQQEIDEIEIAFYEYLIFAENPEIDPQEASKLAIQQWKEDKEN